MKLCFFQYLLSIHHHFLLPLLPLCSQWKLFKVLFTTLKQKIRQYFGPELRNLTVNIGNGYLFLGYFHTSIFPLFAAFTSIIHHSAVIDVKTPFPTFLLGVGEVCFYQHTHALVAPSLYFYSLLPQQGQSYLPAKPNSCVICYSLKRQTDTEIAELLLFMIFSRQNVFLKDCKSSIGCQYKSISCQPQGSCANVLIFCGCV